ncbi:MAG: hypothetical protein MUO21_12170 [Nitrososphaeraceae archaeon]|nr:hypothetical protein [Nitrososphaeraceae archaeon]
MSTTEHRNNDLDSKNQEVEKTKQEEAKKKKLLIEEKEPQNPLPVGEGHETEVINTKNIQ